jgi:hypothetical protein
MTKKNGHHGGAAWSGQNPEVTSDIYSELPLVLVHIDAQGRYHYRATALDHDLRVPGSFGAEVEDAFNTCGQVSGQLVRARKGKRGRAAIHVDGAVSAIRTAARWLYFAQGALQGITAEETAAAWAALEGDNGKRKKRG